MAIRLLACVTLLLAACASPEVALPRHVLVAVPGPPAGPGEAVAGEVSAAPFAFDEVVGSVNLDLDRARSGAVLEVSAWAGGRWTAWLALARFGRVPDAAGASAEIEGGRVDVDTLVADGPLERLRWRVRRFGPAAVRVQRVDLCLTSRRASSLGTPAPPSGPVALDVPFLSQQDTGPELAPRVCSPTALAMVLAFHGVERTPAEVAALAYDPLHDLYGNWPRSIQAAYELGVPARLVRFDDWREVEAELRAGRPLIASIGFEKGQLTGAPLAETPGHLIVIRGFDEDGDVLVNDPAAADAETGVTTYARRELDVVWLARGGTAYLLSPPGE
jgi:hypothetical protein